LKGIVPPAPCDEKTNRWVGQAVITGEKDEVWMRMGGGRINLKTKLWMMNVVSVGSICYCTLPGL